MICYFGTPLGGTKLDARAFLKKRHAFVSFARADQLDVVLGACDSFALDNGAFTAWKQKKAYDFKGYREWVARLIEYPSCDWCVIPDIIDGSEEENDAIIRAWTLPEALSVPVWHLHESIDRLMWLAAGFPRVALGSSGRWSEPGTVEWWDRMADAMNHLCQRGTLTTRLHGLRMLNPDVFKYLPLASADSTTVARNVGIDKKWEGQTQNKQLRAQILAEKVEGRQSSVRWIGPPRRSPKYVGELF